MFYFHLTTIHLNGHLCQAMAADPPSLSSLWEECLAIASHRSFELGNVSDCLDQWRSDLDSSRIAFDPPDPSDLIARCVLFESLEQGSPGLVTSAASDLRDRVREFSEFASILDHDIPIVRDRASLQARVAEIDSRLCLFEGQRRIASRIVRSLPATFSELNGKKFTLLYRGTRDGFSAARFHARCDRKPNTVTIVKTDKGDVFGGYTPLPWDSVSGFKSDPGLESFVFTLENQHGYPQQRFRLKEAQKGKAICCRGSAGPIFGGYDIYIADRCAEDEVSYSNWLGYSYQNDTNILGTDFLAGKKTFKVAEIEVFSVSL
jgi:hypothetical protein